MYIHAWIQSVHPLTLGWRLRWKPWFQFSEHMSLSVYVACSPVCVVPWTTLLPSQVSWKVMPIVCEVLLRAPLGKHTCRVAYILSQTVSEFF